MALSEVDNQRAHQAARPERVRILKLIKPTQADQLASNLESWEDSAGRYASIIALYRQYYNLDLVSPDYKDPLDQLLAEADVSSPEIRVPLATHF